MKKRLNLLLVLAMVSVLLAGCVREESEKTTLHDEPEIVTAAAPTTEPAAEPTLSPEEILLNSLPERMLQAYKLGIVELDALTDLERIVTVGEASAMLQKAYVHRTGVQSKVLNELMTVAAYSELPATRGWIFGIPGQVDLELTDGDNYENYQQWLAFLNDQHTEHLWWCFDDRFSMTEVGISQDQETFHVSGFGGDRGARDMEELSQLFGTGSVYGPEDVWSYGDVYTYAYKVFDSTNGKRFFELEDGYILPGRELTVAEAAEYALIFYNYPNPMEYPDYAAPEEVGKYNEAIITPDLLEKETTLPAVSCTKLPETWRGVVMDDMVYTEECNGHLDNRVYEYEIQTIREAGFNYIGFELDFGWLEDALLTTSYKHAYKGFVKEEDVGKLDLNRLEQLDQVLAWCMKYDIHLNLRCVGIGGVGTAGDYSYQFRELHNTRKYAGYLAQRWQAIARRYADIPNEYLSFTLFTVPSMEHGQSQVNNELLLPALEAIREASPDRCVIADIFNKYQDPEEFAELGTALSYRMTQPDRIFHFAVGGYYHYNPAAFRKEFNARGQYATGNFTWPFEDRIDGEALLTTAHPGGHSFQKVQELAREYGVGFMLSEFGVTAIPSIGDVNLPRNIRYADEAYQAMIADIITEVEKKDCGWCFAHWYSPYGIAFGAPVIAGAEYEQLEDYPYYMDRGMYDFFRTQINGVG